MIEDALAKHDVEQIHAIANNLAKPDLSHIPGEKGLPLAGQFFHFVTDSHNLVNRLASKYGEVFRFYSFHREIVFMMGPAANELVFKNENKLFSNFLAWDEIFDGIFDNNLLERDFSNHKYHRKILQLAFKRNAIEGYVESMNPKVQKALREWPTNQPTKIMPMVKNLLLDVGAEVFLGISAKGEAEELNKAFVNMVAATTDPFRKNIPLTPYWRGVQGRKTLSNFIYKNIEEKRHTETNDIFSKICHLTDDNGKKFSDAEIRDHINFLLFAAHDTTTSALSSILYSIATHTDWQHKLREEFRKIDKDNLDIEDLEQLEKAGLVFREALRMYPPLCFMFRKSLAAFEFKGMHIPANTQVCVSSLYTHYMEDYWSNPYHFDPERFSPERAEEKQNFFQYIPFGGGAHKCLGLHFAEVQSKIFLFHLLKNFEVSKKPGAKFKYNNVPLTFPSNGLPLTLRRIQ